VASDDAAKRAALEAAARFREKQQADAREAKRQADRQADLDRIKAEQEKAAREAEKER
jgi:hypothetical protein